MHITVYKVFVENKKIKQYIATSYIFKISLWNDPDLKIGVWI